MTTLKRARTFAAVIILAGSALACAAQANQPRSPLEEIRLAEDGRGTTAEALAPIFGALRSNPEPLVLRVAVRAVGRLQRPSFVDSLAPFVTHTGRGLRIEAANAIAQSVQRGAGADTIALGRAHALLLPRLTATTDDELGVVARSLGRIPHQSPVLSQEVGERAAAAVSPVAASARVCPRDVRRGPALDSVHQGALFGVLHGIYAVARRSRVLGCEARTLVRNALSYRLTSTSDSTVWVRELAMLALQSANLVDTAAQLSAARDGDPRVRRLALRATRETPPPLVLRLASAGLSDSAPMVRIDAVRLVTATRLPQACDLAKTATGDASTTVRGEAADAVAAACDGATATAILDSLVRLLPNDTTNSSGSWHVPARALVALARTAPNVATPHFAHFRMHPVWQVRAALGTAARATGDTTVLLDLLRDRDANVREETITHLASMGPSLRERGVRAGLDAGDYQVVLAAAQAAESVASIDVTLLVSALERLTAKREETSRDPRNALMDRIAQRGSAANAPALRPYVSDFDTLIARRAAELVTRWTGQQVQPAARPLTPPAEALGGEADYELRITLSAASGGGSFRVRLFTSEAPATVARVTRLARARYYDGKTLHRVVPNFVIQGGGPDANEYVGDGPYMRDELGLRSHTRGTLGISTRGRDTGDAQLFINLIDNFRLDHDYTVFGEIVEGLDVVERLQAGAVIQAISVRLLER